MLGAAGGDEVQWDMGRPADVLVGEGSVRPLVAPTHHALAHEVHAHHDEHTHAPATDRVTNGCPPLTHLGDDLRRRPPQPNRALDRRPAASQLAPGLGSPTPRSPIRAPHPTPAPAPRAPSTLTRLRFLAAPPTCLGDALGGSLPLPSAPNPAPVPSPTAPPVPTPRHAPAPRPWLPAAGLAPGAQAGGEEDVCPAERPRGAAAAGSGGAITAVSLFPWAGATDERAILLLTTNFSGSRRRQRCCAPQLPGPWRRPHQLGARS